MNVVIVGGGICGLLLAINLKERGIACCVYERAPEIKALGVGITLLPHAMREFSALGLGNRLAQGRHRNPRLPVFQPLRTVDLSRETRKICRISFSGSRISIAVACRSSYMRPHKNGSEQMR